MTFSMMETSTSKSRFEAHIFFFFNWDSYPLHCLVLFSVIRRGRAVQRGHIPSRIVVALAMVTSGGFHCSLVVYVDATSYSKLE